MKAELALLILAHCFTTCSSDLQEKLTERFAAAIPKMDAAALRGLIAGYSANRRLSAAAIDQQIAEASRDAQKRRQVAEQFRRGIANSLDLLRQLSAERRRRALGKLPADRPVEELAARIRNNAAERRAALARVSEELGRGESAARGLSLARRLFFAGDMPPAERRFHFSNFVRAQLRSNSLLSAAEARDVEKRARWLADDEEGDQEDELSNAVLYPNSQFAAEEETADSADKKGGDIIEQFVVTTDGKAGVQEPASQETGSSDTTEAPAEEAGQKAEGEASSLPSSSEQIVIIGAVPPQDVAPPDNRPAQQAETPAQQNQSVPIVSQPAESATEQNQLAGNSTQTPGGAAGEGNQTSPGQPLNQTQEVPLPDIWGERTDEPGLRAPPVVAQVQSDEPPANKTAEGPAQKFDLTPLFAPANETNATAQSSQGPAPQNDTAQNTAPGQSGFPEESLGGSLASGLKTVENFLKDKKTQKELVNRVESIIDNFVDFAGDEIRTTIGKVKSGYSTLKGEVEEQTKDLAQDERARRLVGGANPL